MQMGMDWEPFIIDKFRYLPQFSSCYVIPEVGCWRMEFGDDEIIASPDGVMWEPDQQRHYLIEAKCCCVKLYDAPKLSHLIQMHVQMKACDVDETYYVIYCPLSKEFRVYKVKFSHVAWRLIENQLREFLELLRNDNEPPRKNDKKILTDILTQHLEISYTLEYEETPSPTICANSLFTGGGGYGQLFRTTGPEEKEESSLSWNKSSQH
jgi:hypothetical protein